MHILSDLLPAPPPYGTYVFGSALEVDGHIDHNLKMITEKLGPIASMRQVHGDAIHYAAKSGVYQEADALFTDHPELWLAVTTADCLPVLISTPHAVAAVHAGWRGLQKNIIGKTLHLLVDEFRLDPSTIFMTIGPCIRQHSYEVEETFTQYFDDKFFRPSVKKGHLMLDLVGIARAQAHEAGLLGLNIADCGIDTYADKRFFSYRRSCHEGHSKNVQPSFIRRAVEVTYSS